MVGNGEQIKRGGALCHIGTHSRKNGWVVNPSGGLESKSHPIGATGLAQCFELVTQLRGEAGKRQVDDAKVALQHNFGVGSAAVVTLYRSAGNRFPGKGSNNPRRTLEHSSTSSHGTASSSSASIDWDGAADAWGTLTREYSYWIPPSQIRGELPSELRGTFLRNGPGVSKVFNTEIRHPIDGDGLICAVTFVDGKVHLRARFVQSKHRLEEEKAKKFLHPGQMGTKTSSLVSDMVSTASSLLTNTPFEHLKFRNPSNTNVFEWGGKVLTAFETYLPHVLDPTTLETIGLDSLDGALDDLKAMAAHFHIDPISQNLIVMSHRPGVGGKTPTIIFLEFDIKWKLIQKEVFNVPGLNYAHDFAMTKDYYILHMSPFVDVSGKLGLSIATGLLSAGDSMRYYPHLPSKIVLLPRSNGTTAHVTSAVLPKMVSLDTTEPCHIFHFGTCKQYTHAKSGNQTVEFTAVTLGSKFNMKFDHKVWLSNATEEPGRLSSFVVDVEANTLTQKVVDGSSCEFPASHPYRHGLPCRYNYLMASDREGHNIPYRDIVKVDLTGDASACRQVWYSPGLVGEPVFIPRVPGFSEKAMSLDEDDGYVLAQTFDVKTKCTSFVILDAKNVNAGPVAVVQLTHHIPMGFHGTFTPNVFCHYPVSKL